MAGYLFLINREMHGALETCMQTGVYSTIIGQPNGRWHIPHEATFGDYLSMKAGDNVYFFMDRKIYGVGILVNIGEACKYKNYPQATTPILYSYDSVQEDLLYDAGPGSESLRWLCTFEPYPAFFRNGVDMDDLLLSSPEKIRMIRAMQNVSFMKLDDEENKVVRDFIVYKNRNALGAEEEYFQFEATHHDMIREKVSAQYFMLASEIMDLCVNQDNTLSHEMALECGIIEILVKDEPEEDILGHWDYVSHQVIASPFKPLVYADKMDVFGYKHIPGLPTGYDTISDFLVLELKRDEANSNHVEQTLKYVEWIKQEYAGGDYSRIKAYLIASDFDQTAIDALGSSAVRHYTEGGRTPTTATWADLKLLKYCYDRDSRLLILEHIEL